MSTVKKRGRKQLLNVDTNFQPDDNILFETDENVSGTIRMPQTPLLNEKINAYQAENREAIATQRQQYRHANRDTLNATERVRKQVAKRRRIEQTEYSGLTKNVTDSDIGEHYIGEMNNECRFCHALHFESEGRWNGSGQNKYLSFYNCCHHGKVDSLNPFDPLPDTLTELFKNNKFMDNIRSYNSSLAMASCGGNIKPMSSGPYVFRLHGQLYHCSGPLYPNQGDTPKYAQLYVYDSAQASEIRMMNPANSGCDAAILQILHDLMEANNSLVRCYRMLKEVEEEMIASGKDTKNLMMSISTKNNFDKRRYNVARANEIAMVFTNEEGEPPFERDLRVYLREEKKMKNINILDPNLDGLTYPLLFPTGNQGWNKDLRMTNGSTKITEMMYFSYHLQVRKDQINHLLCGGKLTHQLMVDWYCRMEANRLNYLRYNQTKLKAETYSAVQEYVQNRASATGKAVGRTVIFPSSYIGSPRNMQQRYQDAMAIVRKFGKPDLFITVTCNPNCKEIKRQLYPGQTAGDRPDIVARVFNLKLKEIIEDITKRDIFGKCRGFVYVIEFQKRGLPHAHILWIGGDIDLKDPKWVDEIVSAEIPDKETQPKLYELVTSHMLHGPCSERCMNNGVCSKRFPKAYCESTDTSADGFPAYMRRNNGVKFVRGKDKDDKEIVFTNQHVVPYNPYLLLKYNCHINVEVCSSVKAVKYIYKYIYKGHDCADLLLNETETTVNIDEIGQHVNARYVSAPEAMWRLYGFLMQEKSHNIYRLNVHEPNEQTMYYRAGDEEQALDNVKDSTLTAYFKLNELDENARQYLYADIPNYYWFTDVTDINKKKSKAWKKRAHGFDKNVIGRMYNVSPSNIEGYSIKLLLLHKKGATSFDDLKTVEGEVCPTFHEACVKLNLTENDEQWFDAMKEAITYQMPRQLRQLFAFVCVFGLPSNALEIYEHFKEHLIEDFLRDHPETVAEQMCLHDIESILKMHRKSGEKDFNLPKLQTYLTSSMYESYDIEEEKKCFQENYQKLNEQQKEVVDYAMQAINAETFSSNCIYLSGPGGSGKTFVYETLMSYVRGNTFNENQGIAIAVASTGIAATLLKGGRTYHSQFCIPPNVNKESTSFMRLNSAEADRIRKSKIVIWDECTMASKDSLDVVNRLLQEIMENNKAFGGKLIILGGDFRQILNVVRHGNRTSIIESNIKSSSNWKFFRCFKLNVNMRAREDLTFSEWILKLGDGKLNMQLNGKEDIVEIPSHFITTANLVSDIFEGITADNIQEYANRAILCPLNEDAAIINIQVLNLLPGDQECYLSADTIDSADNTDIQNYPVEYLNTINPSGLPPHFLKLKIGAIIMLLRNLNTKRGLCNGTRLIVTQLKQNLIYATVLTGRAKGETVFLPRITLTSNEGEYPFIIRRRQFPVKISFSMTINKAQGQSFNKVGISLSKPVFTHGQLYVAFSRATCKENVKVFVHPNDDQGELQGEGNGTYTRNCVYPEML